MQHRQGLRAILHVAADLQTAANVGAGHQGGPRAAQIGGLEATQLSGLLRLHQVVNAGTAAADTRLHRLANLQVGDAPQ